MWPTAQLCRGASAPERKRWCLPEHVEAFKYLAGSGCSEIAGTDDAANFGVVRNSLSRLGISDSQQVRLCAVCGARWRNLWQQQLTSS